MSRQIVPKFNQCVSVKLTPFKPLKTPKTQCQIHPLRANCRAIKIRNRGGGGDDQDHDDGDENDLTYHETTMSLVYLDYNKNPYYSNLIQDNETRGLYLNGVEMYGYVYLKSGCYDQDEVYYGIDEAGERNLGVLTMIVKTLTQLLSSTVENSIILMVDELQIDFVYSNLKIVVLPMRMYTLLYEEYAPVMEHAMRVFGVPKSVEAVDSQTIYRTFLVYNSVLTVMLKQANPFNGKHGSNISVIIRHLGKCPANKERIKCCDLNYGGNPPGHVMCPPSDMVRRIYHYAKWVRAPNNYKRYYELITAVPTRSGQPRKCISNVSDNGGESNYDSFDNGPSLTLLDWYNFFQDFLTYFNVYTQ